MILIAIDICIKKRRQSRPIYNGLIFLHPEQGCARGGGVSGRVFKRTKRGEVFLKNTFGEENYTLLNNINSALLRMRQIVASAGLKDLN